MSRLFIVPLAAVLVACGGKDDEYVPDTSNDTTLTGCPYSDQGGEVFTEISQQQNCALCPADWECETYENFNSTKCFLPCSNQAECDECASGSTCSADSLGASDRPVRICKD